MLRRVANPFQNSSLLFSHLAFSPSAPALTSNSPPPTRPNPPTPHTETIDCQVCASTSAASSSNEPCHHPTPLPISVPTHRGTLNSRIASFLSRSPHLQRRAADLHHHHRRHGLCGSAKPPLIAVCPSPRRFFSSIDGFSGGPRRQASGLGGAGRAAPSNGYFFYTRPDFIPTSPTATNPTSDPPTNEAPSSSFDASDPSSSLPPPDVVHALSLLERDDFAYAGTPHEELYQVLLRTGPRPDPEECWAAFLSMTHTERGATPFPLLFCLWSLLASQTSHSSGGGVVTQDSRRQREANLERLSELEPHMETSWSSSHLHLRSDPGRAFGDSRSGIGRLYHQRWSQLHWDLHHLLLPSSEEHSTSRDLRPGRMREGEGAAPSPPAEGDDGPAGVDRMLDIVLKLERLDQTLSTQEKDLGEGMRPKVQVWLRERLILQLSRSGRFQESLLNLKGLAIESRSGEGGSSSVRGSQMMINPLAFEDALERFGNSFCIARDGSPFSIVEVREAEQGQEERRRRGWSESEVDRVGSEMLRITLALEVEPTRQSVQKVLGAMSERGLRQLFPFSPRDVAEEVVELEEEEEAGFLLAGLGSKYQSEREKHPWDREAEEDGLTVDPELIEAFTQSVAEQMAQRGDISAGLHLIDLAKMARVREDQQAGGGGGGGKMSSTRDHPGNHPHTWCGYEVYSSVMSSLVREVARSPKVPDWIESAPSVQAPGSNEIKLAMRVYFESQASGHVPDRSTHDDLVLGLSELLERSKWDLGDYVPPERRGEAGDRLHNRIKRLERFGSVDSLMLEARRLTTSILTIDPTLMTKGTLSFRAHTSLLGIHIKVRDYEFSKRLYQLARSRRPGSPLWSHRGAEGEGDEEESFSTRSIHPASTPDRSSFGWFFLRSLEVEEGRRLHFSTRLYLDWLSSGNRLSSRFSGMLIKALLKEGMGTVARRLLLDLEDQRVQVPPHLARNIVEAFSEAGHPDHAVNVAVALTRAWKEQQQQQPLVEGNDEWRNDSASPLRPPLELYSIALDKASKSLHGWTRERKSMILELFDEFRLALGHSLLPVPRSVGQQSKVEADFEHQQVSIQTVRSAYNAAIRTHLSERLSHAEKLKLQKLRDEARATARKEASDFKLYFIRKDRIGEGPNAEEGDDQANKETNAKMEKEEAMLLAAARRLQIERLLREMESLGVEPDHDTWGLRILLELSPDSGIEGNKGEGEEEEDEQAESVVPKGSKEDLRKRKRLLRAVQIFVESQEASYQVDGDLNSRWSCSTSEGDHDGGREATGRHRLQEDGTMTTLSQGYMNLQRYKSISEPLGREDLFKDQGRGTTSRTFPPLLNDFRASTKGKRFTGRKPVQIKSWIVSRLLLRLSRSGENDLAWTIYRVWKNRQAILHGLVPSHQVDQGRAGKLTKAGWDKGVEGARIWLLASSNHPNWRQELDHLVKVDGYRLKPSWKRRLERISSSSRKGEGGPNVV
ncbi:hypothetical protein IE53DRAFT_364140 [Violaceomyces palustris]|uniref:Uncharacterized protein n=1 Tax=Violaceomyces palustris TaxID=1673888 RepID=A0ACD0NQM3_9BASI|nr:hypothetical protein IE53DRAFT_364140 [Violaceomyces palustris]